MYRPEDTWRCKQDLCYYYFKSFIHFRNKETKFSNIKPSTCCLNPESVLKVRILHWLFGKNLAYWILQDASNNSRADVIVVFTGDLYTATKLTSIVNLIGTFGSQEIFWNHFLGTFDINRNRFIFEITVY